jgi:hypothetical protein
VIDAWHPEPVSELANAEARLSAARLELDQAVEARDFDGMGAAHERRIVGERDVARLKGEQYADRLDLGVRIDIGAPTPRVISDTWNTLVVFYLGEPDPNWDGTYATLVDPGDPSPAAVGLIHFTGAYLTKFGGLNDEAIHGHPLYGRGLEAYRAHVVHNSTWIDEAEKANSVHPDHRPGWHDQYTHFVISFHDEMFECIANGWHAEVLTVSFSDGLHIAADRLINWRPTSPS